MRSVFTGHPNSMILGLIGARIPGQVQINRKTITPDWKTFIDKKRKLLPEAMKEHGYSTCFVGKWHLVPRPTPKDLESKNTKRIAEIEAMYTEHLPETSG